MESNQATTKPSTGDFTKVSLRVVSIDSINQLAGQFVFGGVEPEAPYAAHNANTNWEVERLSANQLKAMGTFRFVGNEKNKLPQTDSLTNEQIEADPFVKIDAVFSIVYNLQDGDDFTDDDAMSFARLNAHLNLYPYWREFVHSSMVRAGCPVLILPPFNAMKFANQPKNQSAPTKKETAALPEKPSK